MTTALEPIEGGSRIAAKGRRVIEAVRDFDFYDTVRRKLADVADVPEALTAEGRPRSDVDLLRHATATALRAPRQHWLFTTFLAAVATFTVGVVALLITGHLGDVYEAIYTRFPGRPWTYVMREHPWLYAALVVPLAAVPFLLAPPQRWGRAVLTYVIFLIGLLGGHVFW